MGLDLNDLRWQARQGALRRRVGAGVCAGRPHHHRHLVPQARVMMRCTEDNNGSLSLLELFECHWQLMCLLNIKGPASAPLDTHLG